MEPPPPPVEPPPITLGDWTYYGKEQGLTSEDVQDVSADEGGNVYVAGGDALYAKRRDDPRFARFDHASAGLTVNCNDLDQIGREVPETPFRQCRVIAVAGASAGKAVIGFESFGWEAQYGYPWALASGGADVVAFDGEAKLATRARHVFIASPPHVICGVTHEERGPACPDPEDFWWTQGRRLCYRVRRIAVNHDPASPMYGDVWLAGEHCTFAALLANAAERGLVDLTAGWGPYFEDARDVREHLHPNLTDDRGSFFSDESWALSIHPRDGKPWGSNGFRTAFVEGYGGNLAWDQWWLGPTRADEPPWIDVWPDPKPADSPTWVWDRYDAVRTMSHCPDGTLWLGSLLHGLARIDEAGRISYAAADLPVAAVACDPADQSVWFGLQGGGLFRLRGGRAERVTVPGAPEFADNRVQSIQIDRWSSPRILYFAFAPATDPVSGATVRGGGVGAYAGP